MRKTLGAALLLLGMLTVDGCGDSLAALNRLAVVGSIHEDAPLQRTFKSRSPLHPQRCGRS